MQPACEDSVKRGEPLTQEAGNGTRTRISFSFSGITFLTQLPGRISVPIHSESLFTKGCLKELEFTEGRETWSLKAGFAVFILLSRTWP